MRTHVIAISSLNNLSYFLYIVIFYGMSNEILFINNFTNINILQ